MSSVRSWPSLGGEKEPARSILNKGDIIKMGYLKKLKTMKKKFFVLRGDSSEASARLEYYDSEKKFKSSHAAKRSITLKTCFNINKRNDTRHKWVIALYTKNDCFCLVMETEEELEEWLKMLLTLQQGEDIPDGEKPRPTFEHVWQVTVQKKELGQSRNILGPYLLCLTDRTLSLVKMDPDSDKQDSIEFPLQSIRRCGDLDSFFYMEVGQMSVTGAGNLWMLTEDNIIAQNMHAAILSACRNCKDYGPMPRHRSYSTNESARPNFSRHDGHPRWSGHSAANNTNNNYNNQTSGNNSIAVTGTGSGTGGVVGMHQRTYSFPLSPIPPSRRASTGTRPNKKPSTPHSLSGVRERCDSLPSRARTTSEGASHISHPHRHIHLQPSSLSRPQSMYNRTVSYSPPVIDSSPVSPESKGFSTDSAGSSISIDGEGMDTGDMPWEGVADKYGHSLTPDEPVIFEENDDCENVQWQTDDDYVEPDKTMCLTITNQSFKHSPNPSSSGCKSSSPSQGSLPDMLSSPYGSSPIESGAYLAMTPVSGDKPTINSSSCRSLKTNTCGGNSSVNHSRGSSFADEGYVPMAPGNHVDGYVPMEPGGHHRLNNDNYQSGELSPASSCSITSGTPSTDIRFSEYNLEKVSSYVTPSEDDIVPSERPIRAYSVGSRPTFTKRNDILNQSDSQQRARAFSVGSRCPRVHSTHLTPPTRHPLSSSHSSVEPSEDLMLLDFSHNNNKSRSRNYSKKPSSLERLSVPPGSVVSSAASSYSTAEGSYMDMSPRSSPKPSDNELDNSHFCPSPPKNNRLTYVGRSPPKSYMDMKSNFSSSSPPITGFSSAPLYKVPEGDSSYVEMNPDKKGIPVESSLQPNILNAHRDEQPNSIYDDSYVEMEPAKSIIAKNSAPRIDSFPVAGETKQQFSKTSSSPLIKAPLISTSNLLKTKTNQEDYLDMNPVKRKFSLVEDNNNRIIGRTNPIDAPKKANDGYVEMKAGNLKSGGKPSLDKCDNSDYMNMSGNVKKDRKGNRKEEKNRYSSQPINIQSTKSKEQPSSTSPVFAFVGRKHSTGTPPKVPSYLPLGNLSTSPSSSPYSSLGRRTRKTPSRRESKELSSSGSSTPIFPLSLNSPSSPMKVVAKDKDSFDLASKCPVDARSGTVRICYSPADNSSSQPQEQQCITNAFSQQESDYINFNPAVYDSKENTDYAIMKPVNPSESLQNNSAPSILNNLKSRPVDKIVSGVCNLTLISSDENSVPSISNDNMNNNSDKSRGTISSNSESSIPCLGTEVTTNTTDDQPSSALLTNNNDIPGRPPSDPNVCDCRNDSSLNFNPTDDKVTSLTTAANFSCVPALPSSAKASLNSKSSSIMSPAFVCNSSAGTRDVSSTNMTYSAAPSIGTSAVVANSSTLGEKELHYASLDIIMRSDSGEESSSSSNISQNVEPALTYAEIDFCKSACSANTKSPVH